MEDFQFTNHAINMVSERNIQDEWISAALNQPDKIEFINNEELHYIKQIKENGNRFLKIVVNPFSQPKRIITIFFDRRIKEIK